MASAATSGGHRHGTRADPRPVREPGGGAAQTFWDLSDTLLAVLDADSGFGAGNPALQQLLGWPESVLRRTSLLELVHPGDVRRVRATMAALPHGPLPDLQVRLRGFDGRHTAVAFSCTVAGEQWYLVGRPAADPAEQREARRDSWQQTLGAEPFEDQGPGSVLASPVDLSERGRLEEAVRTQAALLDELDAAVIAVDREDRVTSWNRGAERLFGVSRDEALGALLSTLVQRAPDDERDEPRADVREVGSVDGTSQVRLRRRDGAVLAAEVRNRSLLDEAGARVGTLSVCFDASAQIRAERDVLHARNHLAAVTDSMGEGLFALDSEGRVTVMNQAAEELLGWTLEEIAGQTMHEVIHYRHSDGRPYPSSDCSLRRVRDHGETLRLMADMFVRRDGLDLPVTYTAAPLDAGEDAKGCVVVFIDATEVHAEQQRLTAELNELAWVQRVRRVLDEDLFELFAQPIARVDTGEVTQYELLLRVRRGDGSFAPPGEYLTTAEEHGLIGEIDRWVIQQALALAATGMHVELNVSASSIGDEELLQDIERWLSASAADPALLVFEITETALIRDQEAGRRFVQRLHELGCKVALDDFGTGYGGFTYLKQLPVHYLKIDIEFVRDLCENQASRHVVQAVVNLARGFRLQTVAEGVEDPRTLDLLRELGVDFAQGYHIGRPGPIRPNTGPDGPGQDHIGQDDTTGSNPIE